MAAAQQRLRDWFNRRGWRDIIIATPYVWLLLFFLLPFLIVVAMSFATTRRPHRRPSPFGGDWPYVDFDNYRPAVQRQALSSAPS